jgi:soluble lytic murein transglycosylase-like protein
MGELKFAGKIELNHTIKYGTVLYVMLVMLAIPAGICSSQHMALQMAPPPAAAVAPDIDRKHTELIRYFLPLQGIFFKDAPSGAEKAPAGAPPFNRSILRAAQTYKVDAALIRAIIFAESNYNPQAVSRAGARGLMQLMPTTARWLGVEDPFDPELNIDGGVRYFKRLLDRFDGDVELALAAYNAGSRYVRHYGGVPPFKATRLYIKKVLKYHQKYRQEMGRRVDYS